MNPTRLGPSKPLPTVPRPDDLTDKTLGDFTLIRRLGQGGMGQVYLARQISLKRQVAVKILRTDLTANVSALQRFQLEAEAVARINHANIVQVYAIGEADGLNYMALEYVEGRNLREYLTKKGPPDLPIILNIMRQVAAALQRAHEMGIVHRDIKPENILLTRKVEVKVADFGLSRCFAERQDTHLTQSGVAMGTPLYMSPEQVHGKQVDPRSDIYSFGVTCYHLLSGEPPFRGATPFEVAIQHVQNEPQPLTDFGVPEELAAMVHKMMAKKVEDRYQSAKEFLRDLNRLRENMAFTEPVHALPSATMLGSSVGLMRSAPTLLAATSDEIKSVPGTKIPWLPIGILSIVGILFGLTIHWRAHRGYTTSALEDAVDVIPNPARVREKELRLQLDDPATKGDVGMQALLELTQLYIREQQFDKAKCLFEAELKAKPFIKEIQKNNAKADEQFILSLKHLGLAINYAYHDMPEKSIKEFDEVIPKAARGVKTSSRFIIDRFMKRHPEWAKAVADALDRDAKNMGGKLEETLSRYRHYAKTGS